MFKKIIKLTLFIKKSIRLFAIIVLLSIFSCTKNAIECNCADTSLNIFYDKNSNTQVVYQIYKYDGTTQTNLTNDFTHNYWWVRVSPDKTKFLCYRSPKTGNTQPDNRSNDYANADLMVFNIDGSNPSVIIQKGKYGWAEQGVAKWSPDGTKILMAGLCKDVARGSNDDHWRLITTDINGDNPKIISTRNSLFADPAWSPDGTKITYVSLPVGMLIGTQNDFELFAADYNASTNQIENELRLTNDNLYCFDPCWSPNGQYIAYSTCSFLETPFDSDIVRIKPDGTDKKTIMDDSYSNGVPYWTPDSKRLYFHTLGIGIVFSIASCDAVSGGDKKILLLGGGNDYLIYTTPQPVAK